MSHAGFATMDASSWTIGQGLSGRVGGMTIYPIRSNGAVVRFQPIRAESLGAMRVIFEPSCFNGTGEEERVPISLSIDAEMATAVQTMEAQIREKLRPTVPNLDAIWYSAAKNGNSLKAKVRVKGDGAVRCYNSKKEPVPIPERWRGLAIVPILECKAIFVQRAAAGLVLDLVAAIIGDSEQAAPTDTFD